MSHFSINNHLSSRNSAQKGIAFVTVLILLVVSVSLVSFSALVALSNRTSSSDNLATIQAQYAAESGIDQVLNLIYYKSLENFNTLKTAGLQKNVIYDSCMFKILLTGAISSSNKNESPACQYAWDTSWALASSGNKKVTAPMPGLYNGVTLKSGVLSTLSQTISGNPYDSSYDVAITRTDDTSTGNIFIKFESLGQTKSGSSVLATRKLEKSISISGTPYAGDRFAMLTNATNCAFCHLYVDTMERAYDDTPGKSYDRVLVGVLNATSDVKFCSEWHRDSFIAGTLYLRQSSFNSGSGNEYNCPALDTNSRVRGPKWTTSLPGMVSTGTVSTISGDWYGEGVDPVNNAKAVDAASATGKTLKNAKVYYNYPTSATVTAAPWNGKFPDEELPSYFPDVISDLNNNQMVDDLDWANFISAESGSGSLNGGFIRGFRRPSSNLAVTSPVSYDPVALNPALYSTTLEGKSGGNKTQLVSDLDTLSKTGYSTAGLAAFVTAWKGWLLQQALATPNNRDFNPTNPTAVAGYNSRAYIESKVNATKTLLTGSGGVGQQLVVNLNKNISKPSSGTTSYVEVYDPASLNVPKAILTLNNTAGYATTAGGTTLAFIIASNITVNANDIVRIYVNWFEPISWGDQSRTGTPPTGLQFYGAPNNGTGAFENNFYLNYDPKTAKLFMKFCDLNTLDANQKCTSLKTFIIDDIDDNMIFPSSSDLATTSSLLSGYYDGNLIINGGRIDNLVQNQVINISGTVIVNGDIVLRGWIAGRGRLIARGNIYVVGDLIYACNDSATSPFRACTRNEYQQLTSLPQVGFLAGGGIFLGDFDIPDGDARASDRFLISGNLAYKQSNQLDMVNDQTLQFRSPDSVKGSSQRVPAVYYNIPGATGGTNSNTTLPANAVSGDYGARDETAGFLNEILPDMNFRSSVRKFLYAPFGFIANANGRAQKYDNATTNFFLNSLGSNSVIPITPSNGPLAIGDRTNNGIVAANSSAVSQISCSQSAFNSAYDPALPSIFAGNSLTLSGAAWRSSFNFGFWCPSTVGKYVRSGNFDATAGKSPANDMSAWMPQPTQNQALDGDTGMTTGWLGGLLGWNPTTGRYTQLGDLSQTRLIKLMWLSSIQGRQSNVVTTQRGIRPFRTDGILYSPQAVFGFVRSRTLGGDNSIEAPTTTQGRWIHNGSLISYELGFLAPGPYGDVQTRFSTKTAIPINDNPVSIPASDPNIGGGMTLLYDKRMAGFLQIGAGAGVKIKPLGGYRQVSR